MKRTDAIRRADFMPRGAALIGERAGGVVVRLSQSRHNGMRLWTVEEGAGNALRVVAFLSRIGELKRYLREQYPRITWSAGELAEAEIETWTPMSQLFEPIDDMQDA